MTVSPGIGRTMAFFERAADFLTDRVAPRLVIGHGPRNQLTRAELESLAEQELQARIDEGRPGPEAAVRRGPVPDWAVAPRHARPTRPLDAVTVRLDALGGEVAPLPGLSPEPARPPRVPR